MCACNSTACVCMYVCAVLQLSGSCLLWFCIIFTQLRNMHMMGLVKLDYLSDSVDTIKSIQAHVFVCADT